MLGWKSSSHRNQYSQTFLHTSEAYSPMKYHLMPVLNHFIQNTHPRVPQKTRHVQQRTEKRKENKDVSQIQMTSALRGYSESTNQMRLMMNALSGY